MIHLVIDLGFGDGGKGKFVDYLCHEYNATLVFRYTGGPQASHAVIHDGKEHTFHHYGSGTFAGAKTHIGQHVRVDPLSIILEAEKLARCGVDNPYGLITIDKRCVVVTPYHAAHSRAMASRRWKEGTQRGTFGMGVGTSKKYAEQYPDDAIYVGDCHNFDRVYRKLELMRERYADVLIDDPEPLGFDSTLMSHWFDEFASQVKITDENDWQQMLLGHEVIVGEGTQGMLIDTNFGFKPYVTSSDVSFNHAMEMIGDTRTDIHRHGLLRGYSSRHGIGTFPTEQPGLEDRIPESNSDYVETLGHYRKGWLDLHLAHKAIEYIGGIDSLSVGHLDHLDKLGGWSVAMLDRDADGNPVYEHGYTEIPYYLQIVSNRLGVPISHMSLGPTREATVEADFFNPVIN